MAPPSKTSIQLHSGRYFDPLDPREGDFILGDVARGLRFQRFGGHVYDRSKTADPVSCLAHSMRVARLTNWRLHRDLGRIETPIENESFAITVLGALIHDAPEFIGEVLGPIKTPERKAMEDVILSVIAESLVGPVFGMAVCGAVHNDPVIAWADRLALCAEALICKPHAVDWALAEASSDDPYTVTKADLADTLHLFHPREHEDWAVMVARLAGDVRRFGGENSWPSMTVGWLGEMLR